MRRNSNQRRTRPLPFVAPLVLAIKRETQAPGTGKTQTRRLLRAEVPPMPAPDCHPRHKQKHPAPYLDAYCGERPRPWNPRGMSETWCWWQVDDRCGEQFNVGYRPGDIGWVKEAYAWPNDQVTIYRADWRDDALARGLDNVPSTDEGICWRSSRFMPKRESRFVLEITNVRVQRLQDITDEDAKAEGLKAVTKDGGRTIKWGLPDRDGWPGTDDFGWPWHKWESSPRDAFRRLWNEINEERCSWEANPWVVALTFKPHAIPVERFQWMVERWAA